MAGPLDVFSEANGYLPEGAGYTLTVLSPDGQPVRASNGLRLGADASFEAGQGPYDLALVAGGPLLPDAESDPRLTRWLREVAAHCPRYGSICTGAFALGAAGLLDGKRAATHWQNAGQLERRYPRARVEPDHIYCRDGAMVTSAGVTAGIDLSLALLAEDHGPELSVAVAKRLLVFAQRQGGQSQFSPYLDIAPGGDADPLARVQAHVMANPRGVFSVARLAEVAGMSPRHFARKFVEWAGVTPHEFIERVRVDAARNLLERSDTVLKAVAYECGFSSTDRMRAVFMKRLGVSPAQYRGRFRRVDSEG